MNAAREVLVAGPGADRLIDLTDDRQVLDLRYLSDVGSVPFVDLSAEHALVRREIDAALATVIDSSGFVLGAAVEEFESAFADYCETRHAVGVDSGFSALELILRAAGVGPGDEVITAANTFVATAAAIDSCGALPVLVDVDPTTHCIDADAVAAAVNSATKAIIPVHLYGQPADMRALNALAERHGLLLVEDACQAHGARAGGRRAGSLGHAAAFSFYPSKNLGALGDGGMVVTNDAHLAEQVRRLRNLGSVEKYRHDLRGFNRRLDAIHAAVLAVKLPHLDGHNLQRRKAAALYSTLLGDTPVTPPTVKAENEHVFHLFVVETDHRSLLQDHLAARGISTGIHYPVPIHLQPGYQWLGYTEGTFPVTERAARRILSLPIYPTIDAAVVISVTKAVEACFEEAPEWT